MEFLEQQQERNEVSANALHLIVQTMATFLDDEQLQEVQNLFNQFKK